jgi:hypothetical protein
MAYDFSYRFSRAQEARLGEDEAGGVSVWDLGDPTEPYRSTGKVEGEFFELLGFIVRDELVCVDGKARGIPVQQLVREGLADR